jgi:hypothetical protein
MNYIIHAMPVHPSLCLQYCILLFTIATITAFILLLLILFHYYHHYKIVATDKPLRASLFPGAAELTTHLLRLINILWLPLCRINNFGFYFPRRLLRSPILVGHHGLTPWWHGPGLGRAALGCGRPLAPLHLIFRLRLVSGKIGGSAFVSSNSEFISCVAFLKHKNSRKQGTGTVASR